MTCNQHNYGRRFSFCPPANAASMPGMIPSAEAFREAVQAILHRFCRQNAFALSSPTSLTIVADRLWALVGERGLPRPLAADELGKPGDFPDAECSPLVARVLGDLAGANRDNLAVPVRQLVKACFHPE